MFFILSHIFSSFSHPCSFNSLFDILDVELVSAISRGFPALNVDWCTVLCKWEAADLYKRVPDSLAPIPDTRSGPGRERELYMLGASEVSANPYCSSRTSVLWSCVIICGYTLDCRVSIPTVWWRYNMKSRDFMIYK